MTSTAQPTPKKPKPSKPEPNPVGAQGLRPGLAHRVRPRVEPAPTPTIQDLALNYLGFPEDTPLDQAKEYFRDHFDALPEKTHHAYGCIWIGPTLAKHKPYSMFIVRPNPDPTPVGAHGVRPNPDPTPVGAQGVRPNPDPTPVGAQGLRPNRVRPKGKVQGKVK